MERSVPKYFFHLMDGNHLHHKDRLGTVFSDDAEAVLYAKSIAEGLKDDDAFAGFFVDVRDQENRHVAKVYVSLLH
jgi:hypothetical protein